MELARVGEKEELIKTITARRCEVKFLGVAYAMAADMYADRRRLIGIPAIVLSTFVGAMTLFSLLDIHKEKVYVKSFFCLLPLRQPSSFLPSPSFSVYPARPRASAVPIGRSRRAAPVR
jgi:hypothetical protein